MNNFKLSDLQKRLDEVIKVSYDLFCKKMSGGCFSIYNEASMQLQLGVILQSVGQLYLFSKEDHFAIELEYVWKDADGNPYKFKRHMCKTESGKPRCDILISLSHGKKICTAAIELKYFKKSNGETTTDNRFSIYKDIENLEVYKEEKGLSLGYVIAYTDNINYTTNNTNSKFNIGQDYVLGPGKIKHHNNEDSEFVQLCAPYVFKWSKESESNNCFLFVHPLNEDSRN